MKILFVILASYCITLVATDDSVAMESEERQHKVLSHYPEIVEIEEEVRPYKSYQRGDKRKNFVYREREARGYVFELPPGYEIEGKEPKYYTEEYVPKKQVQKVEREKENLKPESSQYPGSYLSHIKEQMNDGKLLGFSSFVEHFSENDDAEELKTAMKEGSLDDIKKLVPKSSVSFQIYHGEEEEARTVKPVADKKPEISWNEINQPTSWTPPQAYFNHDRKKRMRKHKLQYVTREIKPTPEIQTPETTRLTNNLYEEGYQIIPAINYELSGSAKGDHEHGMEQDRQETQTNYGSESWKPLDDKSSQPVKPPETSKIYYEHYKYSKPLEENKLSQVGRIVVDHKTKPEGHFKKPMRFKLPRPQVPALASGEDFNQRFAQIQAATPVIPVRLWSKPEPKFKSEPAKRIPKQTAIKQTDNHQSEKPPKDNGNVFLTKQFQNDVSEYFKNGKSDFEWVPSTQMRYDTSTHGSNPVPYLVKPENSQERKPKKYRIHRPSQPKNIVILGPETEQMPQREFPVSASYKIEKNRKSDEETP